MASRSLAGVMLGNWLTNEVDFVLTFEELMGMFEAKQINFDDLPDDPNDNFNNASADGRGFAVSGGVAQAVVNVIKKEDPTREVKVVSAQGLAECKKMMQLAAAEQIRAAG